MRHDKLAAHHGLAVDGTAGRWPGQPCELGQIVFDAVALVLSEKGARELAAMPPARDFVSDALAHKKFIGFTEEAVALLGLSGPDDAGAEGLVPLDKAGDAARFLTLCRNLRCWTRA